MKVIVLSCWVLLSVLKAQEFEKVQKLQNLKTFTMLVLVLVDNEVQYRSLLLLLILMWNTFPNAIMVLDDNNRIFLLEIFVVR